MPKIFTSETQKVGEIGENIAIRFLVKHNFTILDRNYTKKWGEIDIIAKKSNKLYFIEVKSVISADAKALADKRETLEKDVNRETLENRESSFSFQEKAGDEVNRETLNTYRPEENMHPWKIKRLRKTIQTYLMSYSSQNKWDEIKKDENCDDEIDWQVDLLVVYLDIKNKKAKVKVIEDIVL